MKYGWTVLILVLVCIDRFSVDQETLFCERPPLSEMAKDILLVHVIRADSSTDFVVRIPANRIMNDSCRKIGNRGIGYTPERGEFQHEY